MSEKQGNGKAKERKKETRLKKGKTIRGTGRATYGPGVAEGMVDVPGCFFYSKRMCKHSNVLDTISLLVAYHQTSRIHDLCASMSP